MLCMEHIVPMTCILPICDQCIIIQICQSLCNIYIYTIYFNFNCYTQPLL